MLVQLIRANANPNCGKYVSVADGSTFEDFEVEGEYHELPYCQYSSEYDGCGEQIDIGIVDMSGEYLFCYAHTDILPYSFELIEWIRSRPSGVALMGLYMGV